MVASAQPDRTTYYPGAHQLHMRWTAQASTGRLLGVQLVGHRDAEVAKRIDTAATALHHHMTVEAIDDLDLSYAPPFATPLGCHPARRPSLAHRHTDTLTAPLRLAVPLGNRY
jgi:Pyridine nucleotide-disulphide oxidoreductase, dimerisation domain